MANRIVPKKSSVASKQPLASDLVTGEIAINLADKLIYTKDASGTVITLGGGASSGYLPLTGGTLTGASTVSASTWVKWSLAHTGVTAQARQGSDGNGLNFTTNALFSGGWVEDDSTKKKFAYIQHLGNGRHEFRSAPAGAGISWTTSLMFDETSANFNVPLSVSNNTVLHAGNYSSYALPLSGGTLTGTLYGTTVNATLESANARFKFKAADAWGGSFSIIGLDWGGAIGTYKNLGVYDYANARSMFEVYGDTRNIKVYGNVTTDGLFSTSLSSGSMLSHGAMTDAFGWSTSYGQYIGTNVGGSTKYLYGSGMFYDGAAHQTLLHSANSSDYSLPRRGLYVNQGSDSTARYYLIGTISANNGSFHVRGNIGGHDGPAGGSQGAASIGLSIFSRAGSIPVQGYVAGMLGNQDLQVYKDASNNVSIYVKTTAWALVDLHYSDASGCTVYYAPSYSTSVPSGTLVWAASSNQASSTTGFNVLGVLTQGSNQVLHAGNYTGYTPTLTGSGASGTWSISVTGSAKSVATHATNEVNVGGSFAGGGTLYFNYNDGGAYSDLSIYNGGTGLATITAANITAGGDITGASRRIRFPDGPRNLSDRSPSWQSNSVVFDFVGVGIAGTGTGGNYAGVLTFVPWDGTTASTGDASYQLVFGSTAANSGGTPQLRIRKGIDTTWNSWYDILTSANYTSFNTGYTTQAAKDSTTAIATTAFVDRMRSLLASSTTGTLVAGDRGCLVSITAGMTVPANIFTTGDVVTIYNNSAGSLTLTQGTSLTMRQVGTANTGNRTLAQRGLATVVFVSATECVVSGGGLS